MSFTAIILLTAASGQAAPIAEGRPVLAEATASARILSAEWIDASIEKRAKEPKAQVSRDDSGTLWIEFH